MTIEGYSEFGGRDTELAALRNILTFKGVTAPHTGKPFTESFLHGVGGGIGFAYFLFERRGGRPIFIGTRIHTRETEHPVFFETICARLGIGYRVQNSSSAAAAHTNLKKHLRTGEPLLAWTDASRLPYSGFTGFGNFYHVVVVYGLDETADIVNLADRAPGPVSVTMQEFREARETSWSPKYRTMTTDIAAEFADPREAAEQGIRDCIAQMNEGLGIANFGLKGMAKWAAILTSSKEKKSWIKIFSPGRELYCGLFTIYEQIAVRGNVGAASRLLYAEFLDECSDLLSQPALRDVAGLFRASEKLWSELADAHLPAHVPLFAEAKNLAQERKRLFETQGDGARGEIERIKTRLLEIEQQASAEFPIPHTEVRGLLSDIRQHILKVRDYEARCIEALGSAMNNITPASAARQPAAERWTEGT